VSKRGGLLQLDKRQEQMIEEVEELSDSEEEQQRRRAFKQVKQKNDMIFFEIFKAYIVQEVVKDNQ
jgi:hypothetical protein